MKLLLLILFLTISSSYGWKNGFHHGRMHGGNFKSPENITRPIPKEITTEWFTQKLDHFTPTDQRTWQQRYYTNNQYYNPETGGPIFLMIGGEGEASVGWMSFGSWYQNAAKYGAFLFQVEHRYYGQSHPTEDMSTENLRYLTSQQALADLANFIEGMNEKYNFPKDVQWIAFGGSYSGCLSAWLRFEYPHLVHGAVSASGPLLAKMDFYDYFRVVQESLGRHSAECVSAIQEGVAQMGELQQDADGQEQLNTLFNLCSPIQDSLNNENDIANLYESIADNFAGIVQYNRYSPDQVNINTVCDIMVDESVGTPIERLGKVNDLLLSNYQETCLDYKYEDFLAYYTETNWDSPAAEGMRQWTYQTCTEFGFYQTSSYRPQIFGDKFPIEFFVKMCQDLFDEAFDAQFIDGAVNRINIIYGGLDIEVTNAVYIHGSIDPWHALGITETIDEEAPAIYIEGTSHCADMYEARPEDPEELTAARETVQNLIGTWLGQN